MFSIHSLHSFFKLKISAECLIGEAVFSFIASVFFFLRVQYPRIDIPNFIAGCKILALISDIAGAQVATCESCLGESRQKPFMVFLSDR